MNRTPIVPLQQSHFNMYAAPKPTIAPVTDSQFDMIKLAQKLTSPKFLIASMVASSGAALWILNKFLKQKHKNDDDSDDEEEEVVEEAKFIGLKNEGATCYLNSFLQTVFHIEYFRQSVFKAKSKRNESIVNALQALFYDLQFTKSSYQSARKLIYSFGWSSADAFVQHDIQELARVLLDSLEDSLPGITNMFKGTMKNYIKCTEVPYESATTESFLDLQLQVLGCKSVLESFYAYTMTEHLTGENIYKCEEYGEQPAIKGVKFLTLPPVLMLHLKRFQFDYRTGRDQKINNRYTFQNEINLSPFVENSTGEDVYCLQSVLVHTGGVSGGHYFNFVKTSLGKSDKDAWYRFDDDRVTRVTDDEAIDANFGGTGSASAYMLCYIRKNLLDLYMRPTTKEDVPTTLQERIERERSSCTIL